MNLPPALGTFTKVFGEVKIVGITNINGGKMENINETTGKIERRGEKNGRLSIYINGQWYSQFFNNRNITPETKEGMERCKVGENWKIGWVADGEYRNISVMEQEIDVKEDMKEKELPSKSKDEHISDLAIFKACTPIFSGNLHLFMDKMGGDFEAGWNDAVQYLFGLFRAAKKEIK